MSKSSFQFSGKPIAFNTVLISITYNRSERFFRATSISFTKRRNSSLGKVNFSAIKAANKSLFPYKYSFDGFLGMSAFNTDTNANPTVK